MYEKKYTISMRFLNIQTYQRFYYLGSFADLKFGSSMQGVLYTVKPPGLRF